MKFFLRTRRTDKLTCCPRTSKPNLTFCFLVWLTGAMVILALIFSNTTLRFALSSSIAIAIMLPLLWRTSVGPIDIFEPILSASVSLLAMFFLRPLADELTRSYVHIGYDISENFDMALLTAAIGCLSLSIGYISGLGVAVAKRFPTPSNRFPEKSAKRVAFLLAALAFGIFGSLLMASGGLSTLQLFLRGRSEELEMFFRNTTGYLFDSRHLLMPSSLIFFCLWLSYSRASYLLLAGVIALPLIVIETCLGNRSTLMPILVGTASSFYLYRQRRPTLWKLAIGLVTFLALSTYLREHRYANDPYSVNRETEPSTTTATILGTFTGNDDEMFDTLANIISVYPSQLSFKPEALLTDLVIRAIPRVVMREKPMESPDELIATLWPNHREKSRAAFASSIFGSFYVYGGLTAVALLSFLLGVWLRSLWVWYQEYSSNLNAILVYAFVPSITVIFLRGTVPDTFGRMFFTVLPMLLAIRYWTSSRLRRSSKQLS